LSSEANKNNDQNDDLNKEMSKHSTYGETIDKSSVSLIDHYIPTGNFNLNACLTGSFFGGYPNNRAVAIAGPSGTGKTFLLLNAIKQAQSMGYSIVFYDSENAVDRELVEKFGIDTKRFRYEPCNTVQEFRSSVTALTDLLIEQRNKGVEIPRILIALDSAGNLATQKEIDDAKNGSDKADMTRAKLLKSTFRILMTKLGICKIPFLFTNHTYMTQDLFAKQVGGGGCLIPGSLVLMSDNTYKQIENINEGDYVKTLNGDKKIEKTWTFEKPTFKIQFEDGTTIMCSEDHRFFIGEFNDDPLDDSNWVYAKDLLEGQEVSKYCVEA
jgi:RecA/RadA recombinase